MQSLLRFSFSIRERRQRLKTGMRSDPCRQVTAVYVYSRLCGLLVGSVEASSEIFTDKVPFVTGNSVNHTSLDPPLNCSRCDGGD